MREDRWQVGSDFEWSGSSSSLDTPGRTPPWERADETITYVESGRQALTLLARNLRSAGRRSLLAPSYFCDSMIAPFLRENWKVTFVPVSDRLELRSVNLPFCAAESLAFSVSYFGLPESTEWLQFLDRHRAEGLAILSDESHRVLGHGLKQADYRVGSLRKMLPLPDGGFVTGLDVEVAPASIVGDLSPGNLRSTAMKLKREWLDGIGDGEFREAFAAAEALTEGRTEPVGMSALSNRLIYELDYDSMISGRIENSRVLSDALADGMYSPVHRHEGLPVSHLLISGPRIHALRSFLVMNQVFCPIHWPPPSAVTPPGVWPQCFLSVPVDSRYDPDDMHRVASLIRHFAKAEGMPS